MSDVSLPDEALLLKSAVGMGDVGLPARAVFSRVEEIWDMKCQMWDMIRGPE